MEDLDDLDPRPGREYRPLNRTPPEYQTVIKFLLMASILDSVWMSGPAQTGSPCGLVPTGNNTPRRPPGAMTAGREVHNDALGAVHHLPDNVQEALRQLNISSEDCVRDPDALQVCGLAPTILRVLSVLLFNAFVFWSDFGAVLVTPTTFGTPGTPGTRTRTTPGCAPSRWLDGGSGEGARGPDIDAGWAEGWAARSETGASRDSAGAVREGYATSCRASDTTAPSSTATFRKDMSAFSVDPPRTSTEASDPYTDGYETGVPWPVQLFYLVTLVFVIIGMPCCPAVFENACTFLMC